MKKYLFLSILVIVFMSCQNQNSSKEQTKESSQNEEVIKQQPTTPKETEVWEPKPPIVSVDPDTKIPSDAIVLFDGSDLDQWISSVDSTNVKWNLNEDGSMTVKDKTGDIQTKQNFGDIQLHLEWQSNPEFKANGQNRSNSGVFLQNRYEVQILDNNDNGTYVNGQVGSIYKQSIPLAMASAPTGEWNTYDIIYHEPKFDNNGNKTKAATITLVHNGVLIQDHVDVEGTTEYIGWPKNEPHGQGPIKLQDHQDQSGVSYRNIWVRKL
jgi:hypothetical protein